MFLKPYSFTFYFWVFQFHQTLPTAVTTWSFCILQEQFPDLGLCYCSQNNTAVKKNNLGEWESLIDSSGVIQHKHFKASSQDLAGKCHSASYYKEPKEPCFAYFKEVLSLSLKNPKTHSFSLHRDSMSSIFALFFTYIYPLFISRTLKIARILKDRTWETEVF